LLSKDTILHYGVTWLVHDEYMPVNNKWLLLVVATWRVALLVLFLRTSAQLNTMAILTATLLLLALIAVTLGFLNLDNATFDHKGGGPRSIDDPAYAIVALIAFVSILLLPFLSLAHARLCFAKWRRPRSSPESRP